MSESTEIIEKSKKNATMWEIAGTFGGIACCICIVSQIIAEYQSKQPSTLSVIYLIGFLMSYMFWMAYGIRFRHIAIWLPNGIAMILQIILFCLVMSK
jgi:uncharacterized protein with PQ loop repeat